MLEAVYGMNINRGCSPASPFELLYGRSPLLTGASTPARTEIPSIDDEAAHGARHKLSLMAKKEMGVHIDAKIGDMVHIWRDGDGWIGPAPVPNFTKYEVAVCHNDRIKTASRNRIRKVLPVDEM